MASADINEMGLADLSARLAAREISSGEAVSAALGRLERLAGKLNAFITVLGEQARAEANKADDEIARGWYRGPLHGVPVTIKDMFETAGTRTTGGSKILKDWIPDSDSALVTRLHQAGAIIIAKTNLDEFGHGGTSTLSYFGPVHNPWNLERIAGGSSGGSAAAVAAGIGPISYGTETGSSVRRPASYCGIVGFKPTFGIISRHGSFRDPRFRKAIAFYLDLYASGLAPSLDLQSVVNIYQQMAEGYYAMLITGPWARTNCAGSRSKPRLRSNTVKNATEMNLTSLGNTSFSISTFSSGSPAKQSFAYNLVPKL